MIACVGCGCVPGLRDGAGPGGSGVGPPSPICSIQRYRGRASDLRETRLDHWAELSTKVCESGFGDPTLRRMSERPKIVKKTKPDVTVQSARGGPVPNAKRLSRGNRCRRVRRPEQAAGPQCDRTHRTLTGKAATRGREALLFRANRIGQSGEVPPMGGAKASLPSGVRQGILPLPRVTPDPIPPDVAGHKSRKLRPSISEHVYKSRELLL